MSLESISYLWTLFTVGLLSSVTSLNVTEKESSVYITWAAPFTLDISNSDPDIHYCVNIDIFTFMSHVTVHSECEITKNSFNFTFFNGILRECFNYNITIVPINLAGHGQSTSMISPNSAMYTGKFY